MLNQNLKKEYLFKILIQIIINFSNNIQILKSYKLILLLFIC